MTQTTYTTTEDRTANDRSTARTQPDVSAGYIDEYRAQGVDAAELRPDGGEDE